MRLTWLPDVLRAAGCKVVTIDGWQDRGKDISKVLGVVWHHDAAHVNATNEAVDRLLVNGRPDLPGPLCQLGLRRDGTWVVIAAGRANHNGYGEWGNQSIGIEARNNGIGQDWPPEQVQAWVKGTAAICAYLKLTASQVKGHKETDPRRKIDPAGIDMNAMRQRIAPLITYQPPTAPDPIPEDIDMTKAELEQVLAAALAPIKTELAEVKRQVATSADPKAKGGATLRWITTKAAKQEKL